MARPTKYVEVECTCDNVSTSNGIGGQIRRGEKIECLREIAVQLEGNGQVRILEKGVPDEDA